MVWLMKGGKWRKIDFLLNYKILCFINIRVYISFVNYLIWRWLIWQHDVAFTWHKITLFEYIIFGIPNIVFHDGYSLLLSSTKKTRDHHRYLLSRTWQSPNALVQLYHSETIVVTFILCIWWTDIFPPRNIFPYFVIGSAALNRICSLVRAMWFGFFFSWSWRLLLFWICLQE